ncbi:TetR/AcrR family transcriptional regulator [Pseudalkalibacillus berkeleyi]|uniref:TetR/AcrR family transcriptional regulator n=1 Tax=Pseudalkalibacillus berkeleyi TaxID=1069813 RepID=A0ABS9GXI0_9BACL|nr:TetR/AcrR family transcriptional regulator [Pseudalkalibacillus berkeleyi]MCF6136334.1 TetR/AcrR family transcriptional regulator [Pseudalkalibacillus berkeleyi]
MTNKREAAKQVKRKRILDESIKLFSTNGYTETTIQMVANAAGISFGSVFTYFETKETLLEATVMEPLEEVREQLMIINYETEDVTEELKNLIQRNIRLFSTSKIYLQLVQQIISRPDRHPKLLMSLDAFFTDFVNHLIPLIEKGQKEGKLKIQDPELVATAYFSFLNGIRLTMGLEEDHIWWEKFIDSAYLLFGPID